MWNPCRGENLILVGFMGAGKSTVALELARATGFRAVDLDQLIVRRCGRTIPEIFAREGEASFRELEAQALRSLSRVRGMVLSTGGGIVGRQENWTIMRQLGPVVYLKSSWETLKSRLGGGEGRPLASGQDSTRVAALWQQRLPLYEQADFTVDTEGLSPAGVACQILHLAGRGSICHA